MPSQPPPRRNSPPPTGALERLYVYWLASTIVLLLMMVVLAALIGGALRSQDARITALEKRLASPVPPPAHATPAPSQVTTRPAQPSAPPPAPPTAPDRAAVPPPSTTAAAPPATAPSEPEIRARLERVSGGEPVTISEVADRSGAGALLDEALVHIARARWSGETWERLASLARLLGRDANAEAFARRAALEGSALAQYREVSVRSLLARGRAADALPLAEDLADATTGEPTARVLLATALLGTGRPTAAEQVLADLGDPDVLDPRDRLLLGRDLLALEQWDRLASLLDGLEDVPPEAAGERQFLTALVLVRRGRLAEGLAMLDYLAGQLPPAGSGAAAGLSPAPHDVLLWRGVALTQAEQPDAARAALQAAAELDPSRPEAHYRLGLLEQRLGRTGPARAHLENAVALAPQFAAAWEALAIMAFNDGDMTATLQNVFRALDVAPRRASSHFLAALAQARLDRREAAAGALIVAFQLDPTLLEEARQTETLLRVFTPQELERLAAPATTAPADTQPAAPEGESAAQQQSQA